MHINWIFFSAFMKITAYLKEDMNIISRLLEEVANWNYEKDKRIKELKSMLN